MKQIIAKKNTFHHFRVVSSTMNVASKFANNGCSNYTVVLAEQQKSGFGRLGRAWISDLGGLYFSIIVRPNITADLIGNISFGAAVDIANIIRNLYGIDARLKWPNDILVNNRKICGILSRTIIEGDKVSYINLGVGINVNNKPNALEPHAISIYDILGREVYKHDILSAFLDRFQRRTIDFETEKVVHQWKKLNVTIGRFVRIVTVNDQIEGLAEDLDSKCGLIVLMSSGSRRTVIYGDCFHC